MAAGEGTTSGASGTSGTSGTSSTSRTSSANGLDRPEVRAWLARLETEAAVLPEERRTELRAGVEDYLADAVRDAGPDDGRAAERAIAELGSPAALVAEAGGYALSPVDALDPDADEDDLTGTPWLEVATVTLLAASVVLALVKATEAFAPVPWFLGTLLVLLSRRWSAGDKALAVLVFGVLGVPLLLLGRDELPTAVSLVVSVLLVTCWVAAAVRLLVRARAPREQGFGLRMP
jgi:HAAS